MLVLAAVTPVAARLAREDYGPHARHALPPGLGQQRRRGLSGVLAGIRHACRDKSRDERRREGRPAPAGHPAEVPHLAGVWWLVAYVLSGCEGIDQPLARRVHVHPGPVVGEVGPAAPVSAEGAHAYRPAESRRPERER